MDANFPRFAVITQVLLKVNMFAGMDPGERDNDRETRKSLAVWRFVCSDVVMGNEERFGAQLPNLGKEKCRPPLGGIYCDLTPSKP